MYRFRQLPRQTDPGEAAHHAAAISPGGQTTTTLCTCAALAASDLHRRNRNDDTASGFATSSPTSVTVHCVRDANNAFAVSCFLAHGERVVLGPN